MNLKLAVHRSILVGSALGVLFWILEAVVHAYLFRDGRFPLELLAPGRHEVWMRLVVVALLVAGSFFTNITVARRREVELALNQVENEDRTIFENTGAATILVEADTTIVKANREFELLCGYRKVEIEGRKSWTDLVSPDCLAWMREYHKRRRIDPAAAPRNYDCKIITKEGGERDTNITVAMIPGTGRSALSFFDITDSKQAAAELQQNHRELSAMLGQVLYAKREWEMTMDCIEHMVILIDGAGLIKRCNRAVKEIAALPYKRIIGRQWQELLMADKVETGTVYGDGIELSQPATGRWFVLNSYPFKEEGYEGSWSVITMHESTAMKRVTEEVEQRKQEIEEHREKLQLALREISSLIQQVACLQDFGVRFKNPKQRKCYEVMGCAKENCPCFGQEPERCWQTAGSSSSCRTSDASSDLDGNCAICPVFKAATSDPVYQIGERFNNMMYIVESKSRELERANQELKAAQAQVHLQEAISVGIGEDSSLKG